MQEKTLDQELEEIDLNEAMAKIKRKIMVMSNKGGVGKSTVSANIVDELASQGYQTGLLDIDIHGPSQAKIFNIKNPRLMTGENNKIVPFQPKPNLKIITAAGILEDENQPIIWRGPLKMGIIKQFLKDVAWDELDYLIIDSPPGTGDEPLTIAQLIPDLDAMIIVTTPQDLALLDSRKAIAFARKLNTKILGIIENMAYLDCPHCNEKINLFKTDKNNAAKIAGIDVLAQLPFEQTLLRNMDEGVSFMEKHKDTVIGKIFIELIDKIKIL